MESLGIGPQPNFHFSFHRLTFVTMFQLPELLTGFARPEFRMALKAECRL
jgi:hypothetical protein